MQSQVNESVYLALHDCGVEIYPGHVVVDVHLTSHSFLQGIRLENKLFDVKPVSTDERDDEFGDDNGRMGAAPSDVSPQFVTLECATLLCCVVKSCDADVFAAINESGLVYDGGVVVDEVRISVLSFALIFDLIFHLLTLTMLPYTIPS